MFQYVYTQLFPPFCCLCDDKGLAGLDLCESCYNELPHNLHPCSQCGIPLKRLSHPARMSSLTSNVQVCGRCLGRESNNLAAFDAAIVPYLYRPPVDHMVTQLKFSADTKFSRIAGELLSDEIERKRCKDTLPDMIVPVPLHPSRLKIRGFNQAELIANIVANKLDIPCRPYSVQRTKPVAAQSRLTAKQREANMRAAFNVVENVAGKAIAIVDDVLTTGATARSIARPLRRAGAEHISVWAFARTP